MELGRNDEAMRALTTARRGAKTLGAEGHGLLASIVLREAALGLWQARWADARRLSLEAIGLLEGGSLTHDDKATLADAFRYHDISASELEGDEAMVHLQHALDLYDELGDEESRSKVLSLLGVRAYYRGAWSTAAGLYAQAESAAEAAGDTIGAAIESANVAEILVDQGRVQEAVGVLGRACHVFQAAANPFLVAFATGYLARAHLRSGDTARAKGEFEAAASSFRELDDPDSLLDVTVRLIEAEMDAGDHDTARAQLAGLGALDDLHGAARSRALRQTARIAELDGDRLRALALTVEAADAAGGSLFERALCLAQLARWSGSDAALRRAEAETILTDLGVIDIHVLLSSSLIAPSPESQVSP